MAVKKEEEDGGEEDLPPALAYSMAPPRPILPPEEGEEETGGMEGKKSSPYTTEGAASATISVGRLASQGDEAEVEERTGGCPRDKSRSVGLGGR